jgi:hypothetical protein
MNPNDLEEAVSCRDEMRRLDSLIGLIRGDRDPEFPWRGEVKLSVGSYEAKVMGDNPVILDMLKHQRTVLFNRLRELGVDL